MGFSFKASVGQQQINGIISGIRWLSQPALAKSIFAGSKVKRKLLDYLRSIFPVSQEDKLHLGTGFRTYDTNQPGGRVGFIIQHRQIKEERIRKILLSLEKGSRGYYQFAEKQGRSGRPYFSFIPGDNRGDRHFTEGANFASFKRLHIPARAGLHYMQRTYDFALELTMQAKPEFFKKVKAGMKNPALRTIDDAD